MKNKKVDACKRPVWSVQERLSMEPSVSDGRDNGAPQEAVPLPTL